MRLSSSMFVAVALLGASSCTVLLGKFSADGPGGAGGGASASTGSTSPGSGGTAGASSQGAGGGPCAMCSPDASCDMTSSPPKCVCNKGFTGNGIDCKDVDECAASPCDANATCSNTPGSFVCKCKLGYVGDGSKCTEQWVEQAVAKQLYFGKGYQSYVAGGSTVIYFANGPQTGPVFIASFDLSTKSIGKLKLMPTDANNYCHCGYGPVSVVIGTTLYTMGNYGTKYQSGVWSTLAKYVDPMRRGEASGAVSGNDIFLIGGRGGTNGDYQATVLAFDTKTETFEPASTHPDYPWGTLRTGATAEVGAKIYVMGGSVNGNDLNRAAVYDTTARKWEKLPDVPSGAFDPDAAALAGKNIFYTNGQAVWRFEIATNAWAPTSFTLPVNGSNWRMVAAGSGVYALGDYADGIHIFRLNAY